MERHCINAFEIAKFLDNHFKIKRTFYPSLSSHPQYEIAKSQMNSGGAMIAFEINGDKQQTFNFLNKLNLIDISNNLGDSKSLITHPATTTHSNLSAEEQLEINIKPTSCRLSVGIEHHQDLINDIKNALEVI